MLESNFAEPKKTPENSYTCFTFLAKC
uniref:Uncharacterized protein n=1 Tax=Arundo donax TaxID=35708 RepID=A0A0A9FI19_ARUDO